MINKFKNPTKQQITGIVLEQFGMLDDERQSPCINLPSELELNKAYMGVIASDAKNWKETARGMAEEIYSERHYERKF